MFPLTQQSHGSLLVAILRMGNTQEWSALIVVTMDLYWIPYYLTEKVGFLLLIKHNFFITIDKIIQ